MYGLIGQMLATPGNRDALAAILLAGIAGMPGCLSYVVAQDPTNPDALWVTEVWASQAEGSFNRRREEGKLNNDGSRMTHDVYFPFHSALRFSINAAIPSF